MQEEGGGSCPLPSPFHKLLPGNCGKFSSGELLSWAYDLMKRQVLKKQTFRANQNGHIVQWEHGSGGVPLCQLEVVAERIEVNKVKRA